MPESTHWPNLPHLQIILSTRLYFQELGLLSGTPVGTSLIDAHAGGVGVMESVPDSEANG